MNTRLLAVPSLPGIPESSLYRLIHFEKYRKPSVVEYPARAVVLNPRHARHHEEKVMSNDLVASSCSLSVSVDESKGSDQHESNEADNDGDPMKLKRSSFLCAGSAFRDILQLGWKEVGRMGRGIQNLGNTCFMNAVLQCIAYTPGLSYYFANSFKVEDTRLGAPYDFAFVLGETIRDMLCLSSTSDATSSPYRPAKLVNQLPQLSPHFRRGRQCDAHEFAVQLLNHAQKSILFRLVENTKLPHHVAATSPLLRICGGYLMSQVLWKRKEEVERLMKSGKKQMAKDLLMEGNSLRATKKMRVQNLSLKSKAYVVSDDTMSSITYDPMTILSVELSGQTLEHCLQKFCEKEKLDGRCYTTPRQVGVHAHKQLKIHIPPNVLIIQLKRFSHSGAKAGKYIKYPLQLDLHPFCTVSAQQFGSHKYVLNAFCIHSGTSINCGHYYAVVRGRNSSWYECNDQMVRMISESEALSKEAYMLFYSRCHPFALHDEESKGGSCMENIGRVETSKSPSTSCTGRELLSSEGKQALFPLWWEPGKEAEETMGTQMSEHELRLWKLSNRNLLRVQEGKKDAAEASLKSEALNSAPASPRLYSSYIPSVFPEITGGNQSPKFPSKKEEVTREDRQGNVNLSYPQISSPFKTFSSNSSSGPLTPSASDSKNIKSQVKEEDFKKGKVSASFAYAHPFPARSRWGESITHGEMGKSVRGFSVANKTLPAIPTTITRSPDLPKFQQRIKDPLWEIQMDRGRRKKVKTKNFGGSVAGDASSANPFQKRSESRMSKMN